MADDQTRDAAISSYRVPPYDGNLCTKRDHVVGYTIAEDDTRMHSCDCRSAMIGNGKIEIRFGILLRRFPDERLAALDVIDKHGTAAARNAR